MYVVTIYMRKPILFITSILFLIIIHKPLSSIAADPASILIINQVRGVESCCLPGNTEIIERIQSDKELSKLPIGWALRFDVINEDSYTKYFKDNNNLGLLLEITPSLASASGVLYKGKLTGEDWYLARNAFLIGYTKDERKKLIDTVLASFKKTFGYYPSFTV